MKKIALLVGPVSLAIIIFAGFLFFSGKSSGKGALQVTANPKSNVFLDGKLIGQTPFSKSDPQDMLPVGVHKIKITPLEGNYLSFEDEISINQSVLTVVDRTFGKSADSEGSIITLTPISDKNKLELLILSIPDKAHVLLDNSKVGDTPLLLKNITQSDHEIILSKDLYKDKTIRIHSVNGYKLTAKVFMAIEDSQLTPTPIASPSATPKVQKIRILSTPTGFLRVRSEASVNGEEIGRVVPGDQLELIEETVGWMHIRLQSGKDGFISSQYVVKE